MTTLSFEVQIFVQRMEKLLQTTTDELHEKFDHIERKRDEKRYRKNKRDDTEHERIVRKEERMKRKIPSFEEYWENLVKDKIQGNVGEKEKEEGLVHEKKKRGLRKMKILRRRKDSGLMKKKVESKTKKYFYITRYLLMQIRIWGQIPFKRRIMMQK